jgi:hypothetical protein
MIELVSLIELSPRPLQTCSRVLHPRWPCPLWALIINTSREERFGLVRTEAYLFLMKECTSHDPDHPLGNVTYTRVTRRRRSRQPPVSAGERSRGQTDRLGPEWSEAGVSKSRERAGRALSWFPPGIYPVSLQPPDLEETHNLPLSTPTTRVIEAQVGCRLLIFWSRERSFV